jgi:hypothetical protein
MVILKFYRFDKCDWDILCRCCLCNLSSLKKNTFYIYYSKLVPRPTKQDWSLQSTQLNRMIRSFSNSHFQLPFFLSHNSILSCFYSSPLSSTVYTHQNFCHGFFILHKVCLFLLVTC